MMLITWQITVVSRVLKHCNEFKETLPHTWLSSYQSCCSWSRKTQQSKSKNVGSEFPALSIIMKCFVKYHWSCLHLYFLCFKSRLRALTSHRMNWLTPIDTGLCNILLTGTEGPWWWYCCYSSSGVPLLFTVEPKCQGWKGTLTQKQEVVIISSYMLEEYFKIIWLTSVTISNIFVFIQIIID